MTRRIIIVGQGPAADALAAALEAGSDPVEVVRVADTGAAAALVGNGSPAADLVVEARPDEPLAAKAAALAALLAGMPATVPIAVVTRSHTLDELLPSPRHGSRVVGLRLLPGTPVAEIAMPAAFDDGVVDAVLDLLEAAGLVALPCGDGPGRIVDRLVAAAALDAQALLVGGLATPATIAEGTAQVGLSLATIETDELPAVAAALHVGLGDAPRFAPPVIVGGPAVATDAGASPGGTAPLDVDAVADRLGLVVIAEAYRLVGEAVAGAEEIERAMTRGAGWAAGPFTMAGLRGLRAVVTGLAALSRGPGVDPVTADRFAMPPLLWQMATV